MFRISLSPSGTMVAISFGEMQRGSRSIVEVIQVVRQGGNEEILVVLCSDGTYGITRNGSLIPSLDWPLHEKADCIAFAERFSQTNTFGHDHEAG